MSRSSLLPGSRRSQSEVVGTVLVLGVVIMTATVVTVVGSGLVDDAQSRTHRSSVETQFARLDSEASLVAYGSSDRREVSLTLPVGSEGNVLVKEDAGWIRLTHHDYSGTDDEVIYNQSMGAVVYTNPSSEVAYQGGGVFLGSESGSILITPPELHHREETLTLPLVQLRESELAGGGLRTVIISQRAQHAVYPDASETYDGIARHYRNPVSEGDVRLTVHSEYYQGWVQYLRNWDVATVTDVYHGNNTVTADIQAGGTYGDFAMPAPGNGIDIVGYEDGHSLNNFEITLEPDSEDNANFANTDWALRATDGGQTFEFRIVANGKVCKGGNLDASITYDDSSTDNQTWERTDAFTENATAFSYDCSGDHPTLTINFTGTTTLTYESGPDSVDFDQHSEHGEPTTFTHGDATSVDHLMNHYLALMDSNVRLIVDDSVSGTGDEDSSPGHSASGGVKEEASFGNVKYDQSNIVTYLHVTESEITVTLK